MRMNWLVGCALAFLVLFVAGEAARPFVLLLQGAETEEQLLIMGFHATVLAVVFWALNLFVYGFCVRLLPLHPFLQASLLHYGKSTNAYLIIYLVIFGYCIFFLGMKQWDLLALSVVAAYILGQKLFTPWTFFKAHVVEYEGHLEEKEKKSEETIDSDDEDT